jgi:2-beta-glucuronyltransferase
MLAEAFHRMHREVYFLSVGKSPVGTFKSYYRNNPVDKERVNRWIEEKPGLKSYTWYTPWHPMNAHNRLLNFLSGLLFRHYGRLALPGEEELRNRFDLVIFESSSGLLLYERIRKTNPGAAFVYRVSDDLRIKRPHPVVLEKERETAHHFDLISVPSSYIERIFRNLYGDVPLKRHLHGIDKTLYDREYPDPYSSGNNYVFIGNAHLDRDFLHHAVRNHPDKNFHIFGEHPGLEKRGNLHLHGEVPFETLVPYVLHADVGLAIRENTPGAAAFSDSLKILQYTHARLPIITPDFIPMERDHVFYYTPGDTESMDRALEEALTFDHDRVTEKVNSWEDLARELVQDAKKSPSST